MTTFATQLDQLATTTVSCWFRMRGGQAAKPTAREERSTSSVTGAASASILILERRLVLRLGRDPCRPGRWPSRNDDRDVSD